MILNKRSLQWTEVYEILDELRPDKPGWVIEYYILLQIHYLSSRSLLLGNRRFQKEDLLSEDLLSGYVPFR